MAAIPDYWFTFDGKNKGSDDADFTITFDKGEPLKTHAAILRLASPVLKTVVDDCKHDMTLHVGSDDRGAWMALLRAVHPGRQLKPDTEGITLQKMEIQAELARKYAVGRFLDYIDLEIKTYVEKFLPQIVGWSEAICVNELSVQRFVFLYLQLAGTYDLRDTQDACFRFYVACFNRIESLSGHKLSKQRGEALAAMIKALNKDGSYRAASMLAEKMIPLFASNNLPLRFIPVPF